MPFRAPAFFTRLRSRQQQAAPPQTLAAAPARADEEDKDEQMLDTDSLPGSRSGPGGSARAEDAHAAAPAEDCPPEAGSSIGSLLSSQDAPPLFPLLPGEELLGDEERAIRLQGFGSHGCAASGRAESSLSHLSLHPAPLHSAASTTAAARASSRHAAPARRAPPPSPGNTRRSDDPRARPPRNSHLSGVATATTSRRTTSSSAAPSVTWSARYV